MRRLELSGLCLAVLGLIIDDYCRKPLKNDPLDQAVRTVAVGREKAGRKGGSVRG